MANSMSDSDARALIDALRKSGLNQSSTFRGRVVRVDSDGQAWANINDGSILTPCDSSMNAKVGDEVSITIENNKAVITGNYSAPATDDTTANEALANAKVAKDAADSAQSSAKQAQVSANVARGAAEAAVRDAATASAQATAATESANRANTAANNAQISADNANDYAARALGNLSITQSVAETLQWITQHGTMTLTTDTALDPTHVYYVLDQTGDYRVGNNWYSVVTEPKVADLSKYYELSIDQSLNNYVATHMSVTNDGLWLISDQTSKSRILVSSGAGSYDTGVHILGSDGSVVASYTDEITIGAPSSLHIKIMNGELGFYQGPSKVAYINNNQLWIPYAVVVNSMQVGSWSWDTQSDGRLNLNWLGGV